MLKIRPKDYRLGNFCFSANLAIWFAPGSQDNVFDLRVICTCGLLFQWGGIRTTYLRCLYLFIHSGAQHILCCVFVVVVVCLFVCLFVFFLCLVYLKLPVSLDCPFLIATSVFSSIWLIVDRVACCCFTELVLAWPFMVLADINSLWYYSIISSCDVI
jgi:hypothetical protein